MKIIFEDLDTDRGGGWNWIFGIVETNGKEYPFTLLEMNTEVGGMDIPPSYELTFTESTPVNVSLQDILNELNTYA